MRSLIPFNDHWLFWPDDVGNHLHDDAFARVTLPHTHKIVPHHNFDVSEYAFVSTYRKRFMLPEARGGRRVFLDFDGAMMAATVSLNGHEFPEQRGGYVPFSLDISDYLRDEGENYLVVKLDSSERPDIPPFGYVVDYLAFSGIYRDVWLRYVEPCYIRDICITTHDIYGDQPGYEISVRLVNSGDSDLDGDLACAIGGSSAPQRPQSFAAKVPARGEALVKVRGRLEAAARLWSLDDPYLHSATLTLGQKGAALPLDRVSEAFGFREAYFSKDDGKFYLNGQPLKLRGLNRHQTYPYIGAAASARLQRKDADILKYELGCNIVRTSHYPQSPHFLQRCDEIGLLVFEEIPGWQHIGDSDWQALALRDLRAMIERDRNHPSIILWGVRINESPDNSAFYEASNTLAASLDSTRPTGGVRNFLKSQFLEGVFTFNDFSNSIQPPIYRPHLVTEYGGHMFPTKPWDQEERLVEHALRHARIQDTSYGMEAIAGAIGWCAFDYNTHYHLGSGDRMCYHGVMDIFRLPKFAADFYASQQEPGYDGVRWQGVVLRAATLWTMGDRNADGVDPLVVFSNCEEVDLWFGSSYHGRFRPDRAQFPHLPYAPFVIPGLTEPVLWGKNFQDLHLVGYIGGQMVAEQRIEAGAIPSQLLLAADDAELRADGQDTTRVVFKLTDKYGNRLPYTQSVVTFDLRGTAPDGSPLADLLGENPFALMGGQAALYVRARHTPGVVTLRAVTPRLPEASITITLK